METHIYINLHRRVESCHYSCQKMHRIQAELGGFHQHCSVDRVNLMAYCWTDGRVKQNLFIVFIHFTVWGDE